MASLGQQTSMLSEYKFYMVARSEGVSYSERYTSLGKAQQAARLRAHNENEPLYVLEAVWVCKPKQSLEEQNITEHEPEAG